MAGHTRRPMDTRNTYTPTIGKYQWISIHPHSPTSGRASAEQDKQHLRKRARKVFLHKKQGHFARDCQTKTADKNNPAYGQRPWDMGKSHPTEEHSKRKPTAHQSQEQVSASSTDQGPPFTPRARGAYIEEEKERRNRESKKRRQRLKSGCPHGPTYPRTNASNGLENERHGNKFLKGPQQALHAKGPIPPSRLLAPKNEAIHAPINPRSSSLISEIDALVNSGATNNFITQQVIGCLRHPHTRNWTNH